MDFDDMHNRILTCKDDEIMQFVATRLELEDMFGEERRWKTSTGLSKLFVI